MHSANFTAVSLAVLAVLALPALVALPELLAVPVSEDAFEAVLLPPLLPVPVSEDAFEPQPALIRLIRATSARAANGRGSLLMFAPYV